MISQALVSKSRRRFLSTASAAAVACAVPRTESAGTSVPPEVRRIRLSWIPALCLAPQYLAKSLLYAEGFQQVEYVRFTRTGGGAEPAASVVDVSLEAVGSGIVGIDAGLPLVHLAGVHLGCYELFAQSGIQSFRDLKHGTIPIDGVNGPQHLFLSTMASYVGLDPRVDFRWEVHSSQVSKRLLEQGRVDAYLGLPPDPQDLRARGIGHVIVNTTTDKPWSQYYCCLLTANAEFARKYPNATLRAVRAILKAADLCASAPEAAARELVKAGYTGNYDVALKSLKDVDFRSWRSENPENTIRFHSVRLHEIGVIKSTPAQILARGTDWRYLDLLKRELKG